jgi:hypothetical protein
MVDLYRATSRVLCCIRERGIIKNQRCRRDTGCDDEGLDAETSPKPAKPEPNRFLNALRPRPYGLFLDDLPIHIRPDLPAARVQT